MGQVTVTTYLNAPADDVWQAVQTADLLRYVSRPVLVFKPIDPPQWPAVWGNGPHKAGLWFLGVLPIGPQYIDISRPPPEGATRYVRDNGHSPLIQRWDHLISIAPEGEGTRYTDRIDIEAGLLTRPVMLFARFFYAHRQRRWRKLVRRGLPLSIPR